MFRAQEEVWCQFRDDGPVTADEEEEEATPAAVEDVNTEDQNEVRLHSFLYLLMVGHVFTCETCSRRPVCVFPSFTCDSNP
jgi:hypothetical protein